MPVKSTALKAVLSFVAAGYKREGSGDKKEMYKNTKNIKEIRKSAVYIRIRLWEPAQA